jgi:hypothetical protein
VDPFTFFAMAAVGGAGIVQIYALGLDTLCRLHQLLRYGNTALPQPLLAHLSPPRPPACS